jgi:hypothetical protein
LVDVVRAAEPGRIGTVAILNAAVEYLRRDPRIVGRPEWLPLSYRLAEVATALLEASEGRATPLTAITRKGGRQKGTRFELSIRAYAIWTLDLMERTGLDRKAAAKMIARKLDRLGVRPRGGFRHDSGKGAKVTADTVLAWRARIDARHGRQFDDQIVREWRASEVAFKPGVAPEILRADLLAKLEAVVRLVRASAP